MHRWAGLLKQQSLITVNRKHSLSACSKQTEVFRFKFVAIKRMLPFSASSIFVLQGSGDNTKLHLCVIV
jgi:hypothetical protein